MSVQAAINAALFVNFVYENWNSNGDTTDLKGMQVLTHAGQPILPGLSYRVLQTIYSNDLATDCKALNNDTSWQAYRTLGMVAVNEADPTDMVIAIRGTESWQEWCQDFKFLYRSFPNVAHSGLTEDGFTDMYLTFSMQPKATTTYGQDLLATLGAKARVTIVGHSLGSALATLQALELGTHTGHSVELFTLASPRVGDLSFQHLFDHVVQNAYRICNRLDVVPKIPPVPMYCHVGDEMELVPGPEVKFDLGCEHAITTYLYLLAKEIGAEANYPLKAECQMPAGA